MDKHDTLLIVSSDAENRRLLRQVLENRFHLLEACNSQQTMLLLRQNISCIAAVLLDISLENVRQEDLLTRQESLEILSQTAIIAMCREENPDVLAEALGYGAADVISLDYDPHAMLHRVENVVDLHLHRQHLKALVEDQAKSLRQSNETMVDALSSIIEYRSVESGQHILRIRQFTRLLMQEVVHACPEYGLNESAVDVISSAASLHDIGKIAIPDAILLKQGSLTQEEREIMNSHAETGCNILNSLGDMGDPEYMRYAYNICRYHHERWDGGGYPQGLAGEDIPICAQVVGLADVYDALTTKRAYKEAFSFDQSVNMILKGECGVFSPKLLECFKQVSRRFESLAQAYADGLSPKASYFDTTLPAAKDVEENTLERIRAKYFALLHYIDGFLVEIDFTQRTFHVIYNPYPELALFRDSNSLGEIRRILLDRLMMPQDRENMVHFIDREIPSFLDQDLRRMSKLFNLRNQAHPEGDTFELTLLRIHPSETGRRSLAVLGRRVLEKQTSRQATEDVYLADSTCYCLNDADFTLKKLGDSIPVLAGYTRQELQEQFGNRLTELVIPEDRQHLRQTIREQLNRGIIAEAEFRVRHKNGNIIWVLDKSRLCQGADGREYLHVFLTDISRTKAKSDALSEKLDRYDIILAQTENVLFEWDVETDSIAVSETWEKVFGFPPALDNSVRTLFRDGAYFHPDDLPKVVELVRNIEQGSDYEMAETRMASAQGRYLWCRIRASALRSESGAVEKVVGIIINIDAEKQAEILLQNRAERDSLTKLLNKNAGRKYVEDYLSRHPGSADGALLIIDLDNFKLVNDQFGHLFGDAVLTKASREIEKMFRSQDIVSRIGGDEFMVLMKGVTQRPLVEDRCKRLLEIFQNIFRKQNHKLPLGCSIGVAMSPENGSSYPELFSRADRALYRAKAEGKNGYWFYDSQDDSFVQTATTRIDSDVEPGLADDNIVHYAFQRLYGSKDVDQSVNDILALVGQKMNVSRVYVFENSDDNRFCSNTYEWCNEGIKPEIDSLQNISYETDIPNYEDNFNEQGIFYCPDIHILPKQTFDIVEPQGIKSMLHCAIRDGGVFRGYIGFDECVEQRYWTKEQIHVLTYFSEMLSVFLLKKRKQDKAMAQAEEISSILDNQDAWIYIIDPESCELQYLNTKTKSLAPDLQPGMPCYKALMGQEQRCPGCPAWDIGQERNQRAIMVNPKFHLEVLADATAIQWQGKQACLLACREIPRHTMDRMVSRNQT